MSRKDERTAMTRPGPEKLREYDAKRDFRRTPEPSSSPRRGDRSKARFVVHEHHARRLHWDLRLEHDGVLLSWAIPNGIPSEPSHNRKAIHVEDHPLSYIDFAGEIPAGSYGAGKVLIWDSGTYEAEKIEDGKVVVAFHGERLRGRYALFHTRGKDWMIHRMDPPSEEREAMPEHLLPMFATTGRLPAREEEWAFEVKWDGVRAITYWLPGRMRIESRKLNDVTSRYPELRALGAELGSREAVLDGEIVAFDSRGRPSFERLQQRMHLSSESAIRRRAKEEPVTYMLFDLLYLDGHSTLELSYRERRALLDGLGLRGPAWRTPEYYPGAGRDLLAATAEQGLEGIVAKRLDSPYRPGQRTEEWVKIKNVNRQELVIGGWLPGKGRRTDQLGALLMGVYEDRDGRPVLRYAGRVGTGFDEHELGRLMGELTTRARKTSPFGAGVEPPRGAHFVEPELVAEIEFSHWTRDRILRHSSYKGLRDDKAPEEVHLELADIEEFATGGGETFSSNVEAEASKALGAARVPYRIVRETGRAVEVEVEGRILRLTNRDKVMYPRTGFTKGDLIDYYAAVAPVVLPHLLGRPLTLKRYPDGVESPYFYEKRCPSHRPDWVTTAPVWSEEQGEIDYCLANDLPTLMWAANLADIELHPSLSYAKDVRTPSAIVFDLDPGAPAALKECCVVALKVRELFDALGMRTFVKTSGSKGLQAYVPLNTPVSYDQTKELARAVAELLEKQHPRLAISRMAKSLRPGRVLIDWSQNDEHKTTVGVYSLRARERPTISTPLSWEEVDEASVAKRPPELSVEPRELLERIDRHGDLFAPMLSLVQPLPDLSGADRTERADSRAGSAEPAESGPGGVEPAESGAEFASPGESGSPSSRPSRRREGDDAMPPRGVKKGSKRARQYEHIKESELDQGASEGRAEEIAARTVNKERARSGESRTKSRSSVKDISSGRRGGLRSGRPGPRGRTREQLYNEAREMGIDGRSKMSKAQLQRAVDRKKSSRG
jgi:bifunctional non-homologous end joining protein LigD